MKFRQTIIHECPRFGKYGVIILFVFLLVSVSFTVTGPLVAPTKGETSPQKASGNQSSANEYAYVGAESCSGGPCHGNTTKRMKLSIDQTEWQTWRDQDRHTRAYKVLLEPDGKRMAKNLGIDKPEEAPRCLVCHAVVVEEKLQGAYYDPTEGVTCEACHGPAEGYLGPHFQKGWEEKKKIDPLGMYDTKNLHTRAEKCLACHLGVDNNKIVDHELIGAGHPRLPFELDIYSTRMPAHWRAPEKPKEKALLGMRSWAVGQAVALHNQLQLLHSDQRSRIGVWPDFIHYDCHSCHHPIVPRLDKSPIGKSNVRLLTDEEKKLQHWRVKDYGGKPGRLVWNSANYTVFRLVVHQAAPEKGKRLDTLITRFHDSLTGKKGTTPEGFKKNLNELAKLTGELVGLFAKYEMTQRQAVLLMRTISGAGRAIANAGYQSAEQAVFSLGSLFENYRETAGAFPEETPVQELIDTLYKDLKNMRSFDRVRFESDMKKIHRHFLKLNSSSSAMAS